MTAGNAENSELQNSHLFFQELTEFFLSLSWELDYSVPLRHAMADRLSFLLYFLHLKESLEERKRVYFLFLLYQ